ncbi:hypothetical protein QE152_g37521 [Popillia japonica]|uniref:Transposase n=1 Tax=Popillia japonica TaxID=7064 RepID=A0AAW1IAJ4_POPJA
MSTNPKDWVRRFEKLGEVENDGCIEGSSDVSNEDETVGESFTQPSAISRENDEENSDSSAEYCSDTEENDGNSSDYYLGKDELTKWRKTEGTRNVRTKSLSIVLGTPEPIKRAAKSCKYPVECL